MTTALHQYRVHCGGLQYITWARSACEAMLSASDLHGTPATSARRLPPAPGGCHQRPEAAMSAGPLHKPTPLPRSQEAQAAWTVGWWQGKVIGFALGMATAVLFGWLR